MEVKSRKKVPIFNIGDVVKCANGHCFVIVRSQNVCMHYNEQYTRELADVRACVKEDNGMFRLATSKEIDKWNKDLEVNHYHYSMEKRRMIDWFLPGDRVIRRNANSVWTFDFFSSYSKKQQRKTLHYNRRGV